MANGKATRFFGIFKISSGKEVGSGSDGSTRSLWVDMAIVAVILALFAGLIALGREWTAPLARAAEIDLSLWQLPKYALFSLSRGFIAYFFSLAFTLVYGTAAARSRMAEKILIPFLDILQGIPVLSFLPGFVIGLVGLFPRSNVGLELACILSIFTGQVWNMTFSYYGSVRSIPQELREAARVYRFGWWRRIAFLEIPSSMIGLVWNSMMSMAGGWFFISVIESFTLSGRQFRLPGLGSYMHLAIEAGDVRAMAGACLAMVAVIVSVDQLFWKPVMAWAQRFKVEETAGAERPPSLIYDLLRRSWLIAWLRRKLRAARFGPVPAPSGRKAEVLDRGLRSSAERSARFGKVLALAGLAALLGCALIWGARHLFRLLLQCEPGQWLEIFRALGFTALRVLAAVLIGAAWTLPAGIWIGKSRRTAQALQPLIQVLASFPMPMLFPLLGPALTRLGLSFSLTSIILMLVGTQWYILFNVVAGAAAIPQDLREVSKVFHLNRLARIRLLYLPAIFPALLTGLITAAGGAWNASIVSEWVPYGHGHVLVAPGIGALISKAFADSEDAILAGSVLALALALAVINHFLWKRLYRFAESRFALNR